MAHPNSIVSRGEILSSARTEMQIFANQFLETEVNFYELYLFQER